LFSIELNIVSMIDLFTYSILGFSIEEVLTDYYGWRI